MHAVKISQFEGPLDLLLQLIEDQKLDITQLSLAAVTEQYLTTLQQIGERLDADALADFLAVAARLLLIKSRTLLPYLQPPDEDEGVALEQQLKLYREFFLAAQRVQQLVRQRRVSFSRERLLQTVKRREFLAPPNLHADRLAQAMAEVIAALPPTLPTARARAGEVINLHDKIRELRDLIWRDATVRFSQFLGRSRGRTEMIVCFLAILELAKQRHVAVRQDALFEEIVIEGIART